MRDKSSSVVAIEVGKFFLEVFEFGKVVHHDVGFVGMVLQVVLVVVLGGVETLQRNDLCDDGLRINLRGAELGNIGFSDFLLFIAEIENRGAVLGTVVRALTVEFSGVVADGKEKHQDLAVGNLRRVEDDFHRFSVARGAGADFVVVGGASGAAGVAGSGGDDAFYVSQDGLYAPEAAACNHGSFLAFGRRQRRINGRLRKGCFGVGAAVVAFSGGPGQNTDSGKDEGSKKNGAHRSSPENALRSFHSSIRLAKEIG